MKTPPAMSEMNKDRTVKNRHGNWMYFIKGSVSQRKRDDSRVKKKARRIQKRRKNIA